MKTKHVVHWAAMTVMAASFLIACQKEPALPEKATTGTGTTMGARIPDSSIPPENVPALHRQALDYLEAHCPLAGLDADAALTASVDGAAAFLTDKMGYDKAEILAARNQCMNRMKALKQLWRKENKPDAAAFAVKMKQLAESTGMSHTLRNTFTDFYAQSLDPNTGMEDMDDFVEQSLDPAQYTGDDKVMVAVFRGIFDDSRDYWYAGPGGREKGCPYWEYANDAIGGLFGLALGGAGSVILGAAASAYTHWECN